MKSYWVILFEWNVRVKSDVHFSDPDDQIGQTFLFEVWGRHNSYDLWTCLLHQTDSWSVWTYVCRESVWWVQSLSLMDIGTDTMKMSRFHASPRNSMDVEEWQGG